MGAPCGWYVIRTKPLSQLQRSTQPQPLARSPSVDPEGGASSRDGRYGQGRNQISQISSVSTSKSAPPKNAAIGGSNDRRQRAAAEARTSTPTIKATHGRISVSAVIRRPAASTNPPRSASPTEQRAKERTTASNRSPIFNFRALQQESRTVRVQSRTPSERTRTTSLTSYSPSGLRTSIIRPCPLL